MPRIGAIFDWDGVIINSADLHQKSWELLAAEIKHTLPANHFKTGFGKRNETIIGKILNWSEDPAQITKWGNRKEEIYRELGIQYGIDMVPGSKIFLQTLKHLGISASIGTSTERKNIEVAIAQNKLADFFSGAVGSEDVTKGKPDPEVFLKAAKLIKRKPANCVVFEDSTHGIEAAISAQMIAVGITTTNSKSKLLDQGANLVVDRLDEIDLSILEDLLKTSLQ